MQPVAVPCKWLFLLEVCKLQRVSSGVFAWLLLSVALAAASRRLVGRVGRHPEHRRDRGQLVQCRLAVHGGHLGWGV